MAQYPYTREIISPDGAYDLPNSENVKAPCVAIGEAIGMCVDVQGQAEDFDVITPSALTPEQIIDMDEAIENHKHTTTVFFEDCEGNWDITFTWNGTTVMFAEDYEAPDWPPTFTWNGTTVIFTEDYENGGW